MGANRCHSCTYIGDVTFKERELCLTKLSLVSHTLTTKMQTINAVLVVTVIQPVIHVMAPFPILLDYYNLLTTKGINLYIMQHVASVYSVLQH